MAFVRLRLSDSARIAKPQAFPSGICNLQSAIPLAHALHSFLFLSRISPEQDAPGSRFPHKKKRNTALCLALSKVPSGATSPPRRFRLTPSSRSASTSRDIWSCGVFVARFKMGSCFLRAAFHRIICGKSLKVWLFRLRALNRSIIVWRSFRRAHGGAFQSKQRNQKLTKRHRASQPRENVFSLRAARSPYRFRLSDLWTEQGASRFAASFCPPPRVGKTLYESCLDPLPP